VVSPPHHPWLPWWSQGHPSPLGAKVGAPPLLVSLITYRDTFQSLGNRATQPASQVSMVKPQHKPHQHRDSLGHHHDHWEWEGETTLPIVPVVEFSKPPSLLNAFLDTLVFWKTTQFHVLAAKQPLDHVPGLSRSSPAPLQDDYSLVQTPNGASNHSILIYSKNRCW
jgi:hypothetical protein